MKIRTIEDRLSEAAKVLRVENYSRPGIENALNQMFPSLKDGRKGAIDLMNEIADGECILVRAPGSYYRVDRLVRIATIEVLFDGAMLVEAYQENPETGERWKRQGVRGLAEKVKGDERPRDAALRGMKEELGIDVLPDRMNYSGQVAVPVRHSAYADILSIAENYQFWCVLDGHQYKPEYREIGQSKVSVFLWET
jgi:hypothetical protein